jgi:phospho-N-acetylmuramoyl-pentapeptide-transferase
MLYHLLPRFSDVSILFNLFVYNTFRAGGALVTALLIAFVLGPAVIRWLDRLRVGQVVRAEGPQSHQVKAGTPTMGGILIISACVISTLLWARLDNPYTWLGLSGLVFMGGIGLLDDYLKVVRRSPRGLIARFKLVGQFAFGLLLSLYLLADPISPFPSTWTGVPFFADYAAAFTPVVFVVFVTLIVTFTTNAVNLTDGLDGLASGLVAIAAVTFAIIAYVTGRVDTSAYLGIFYLPGAGEGAIFALAITGSTIGFLWFNAHPARVFMGDTGSLGLGGALATLAVLLKAEFVLLIAGGVFVAEGLSSLLQTAWFKYTRRRFGEPRRLFRMAPLHHHFEKLGWPESQIVVRFWILGILCAMVAIATLKIR